MSQAQALTIWVLTGLLLAVLYLLIDTARGRMDWRDSTERYGYVAAAVVVFIFGGVVVGGALTSWVL